MAKRLSGKAAIVTGASSGIGEATAIALAREGANVALLARRGDRLQGLENRIKSDCPGDALAITCDVSDSNDVDRAVKRVLDKWSRADILVNNAGVMYIGSVAGANPGDWKRMIDINVLGVMYCTGAVLPAMQEQKSGHIVNISSVSGRHVTARSAAYSATKFAVGAFSDGLRQEVHKQGIRVTLIEPGVVLTELSNHVVDQQAKSALKDWVASMTPLTSEDIANAIMYAVSQPQHVNVNEIMLRPTDQP